MARPPADATAAQTIVTERSPGQFHLQITFAGQSFDCGVYLTRPAALTAARLFVERKQAEASSGRQRKKSKSL